MPQAAVIRGRQRDGGTGSGEYSNGPTQHWEEGSGVPDGPAWEWRRISAALGLGMK